MRPQTAKTSPSARRAHDVAAQLSTARPCIHVKSSWLSPPQTCFVWVGVGWQWASSVGRKTHRCGYGFAVWSFLERVNNHSVVKYKTKHGYLRFANSCPRGDAVHCPLKMLTANPRPPGRNMFVEVTAKKVSREYMV